MNDDEYVIELARNILSSDNSKYSKLLIDLSKYIDSIIDGKDVIKALITIWKKNILPIMLIEMKRDFTNIDPYSWTGGFLIVHTVYDLLTRLIPSNEKEENEFHNRLIPEFIENSLCFYRQLQGNYNESLTPDYRGLLNSKDLLKEIIKMLELIESFVIRYPDFVLVIIESPWFLQVFITDNQELSILMTEWLIKLIKVNGNVVKKISKSTVKGIGNVLSTIFDEIVYHIAITENIKLIEMDMKCILTMLEVDSSLSHMLQIRYKGLKLIILKWSMPLNDVLKIGFSNSFSRNLQTIVKFLDSGLVLHADASNHIWAIVKIQAWWRSVHLRIKLRKTNKAFEKFQKNYRSRKLKENKERNILRIRKELEHQIAITRRRKFREKLEAEVLLMETLPAPIVFKHLEKNRQDSATKIQAIWKGHLERHRLISRQQLYRKNKAAIKIQKCARAWLSRRDLAESNVKLNQDAELGYWQIPGLTIDRKNELIKNHNKWMASHKHEFKGMSEDSQLELHHKSQQLFRRHLYGVKSSRRHDIERELIIARLETDSKLLLSAPNLNEAVEGLKNLSDMKFEIDNFHCKIRPIANRASQLHHNMINTIKQPWWKQLLIEEPLDLDADDDLLAEPVDLDQYMILRNKFDFLRESDANFINHS